MSAIQNIDYYCDLGKEDYYFDGGEPPGEWNGGGAALLGLFGTIEKAAYRSILEGRDPTSPMALCANPGEGHRPGWDLTFSAPKSVSVAFARANEAMRNGIRCAHKAAVVEAFRLLEERAGITRRGHGGALSESVVGLVGIHFEHSVSRALDPQLHTHCLVANVAPRQDGSWGTIESHHLFTWQMAAGALYRAELASRLRDMGFSIEQDGSSFRLAGVPQRICEHYSKRSETIRTALKDLGGIQGASAYGDIISLNTRGKKTGVNRRDLSLRWGRELDQEGFTGECFLIECVNVDRALDEGVASNEGLPKELAAESVLESLTGMHSVFTEQEVHRRVFELCQWHGLGAKEGKVLAENLLEHSDLVALGRDSKSRQLYTTKEVINTEREMIELAKKLRNMSGFFVPPENRIRAIDQLPLTLSEEQVEAVESVCHSESFAILQGSAGAGKSTSMSAVRVAYELSGYQVIGAAIAKSAADNLRNEANIKTHTVAKLLLDIKSGKKPLNSHTVLLVDEAGQLGTSQLLELLKSAEIFGSKVILLGEDKQLDAVERGGSLRYLSKPEVMGATRVETVRRQREAWARKAVTDIRDGKSLDALTEMAKRGLLYESNGADESKARLMKSWDEYRRRNPGKKSLILAQRWSDVAELNKGIRAILRKEGTVGPDLVELDCSVSNRKIRFAFGVGERVKLTKNDYRLGLTNGQQGTLISVDVDEAGDSTFTIALDEGKLATIKSSEYCDEQGQMHISQAYALTVYSSQGMTVDGDVFVYYTSGMDRANSYVACSRHKDNCHLFYNQLEIAGSTIGSTHQEKPEAGLVNDLALLMNRDRRKSLACEHLSKKAIGIERVTEALQEPRPLEAALC